MGASKGGYRCRVAEIRDATWDDLDAVFELLDARSRAAFGISELKRGARARSAGRSTATEPLGRASTRGAIVGYAALDDDHDS